MSGYDMIGSEDWRSRALRVNSEQYCLILRHFWSNNYMSLKVLMWKDFFNKMSYLPITWSFQSTFTGKKQSLVDAPLTRVEKPRSYTPSFWRHLIKNIYENDPLTLLQLEHNILTETYAVAREMGRLVVANSRFRLEER